MDKNIKSSINFLANQAKTATNYAKQITSPIVDIAEDFHSHLSDLKYLQCLQELSKIPQFKENALYFINEVYSRTSEMLVIHGGTQVYIILGDIASIPEYEYQAVEKMKHFASTKQLPENLGQPQSGVYEAFMDMVDSVSVYPKKDFKKSWRLLISFYDKGNSDPNDNSREPEKGSLLMLITCFNHITMFERERRADKLQ